MSLVTHTLPDSGHLSRIRKDLHDQDSFINMLTHHEEKTIGRFEQSGETIFVKKYIHRTPVSMFDLPSFYDLWEVWVRTDIINGKAYTSFLIRLGLIKDTNAETFISNQCDSGFCKYSMKFVLGAYNKMFDWGIFKPIRLNITELDETSSVSRKRMTFYKWNKSVRKLHQNEVGRNYSKYRDRGVNH